MSLLQIIMANYNTVYIDERTGSYFNRGSAINTTSKESTPLLIKNGAVVSSTAYYKTGSLSIGVRDYTIISKGAVCSEHSGTGEIRPLTLNGSKLRTYIDGSNFDSTVDLDLNEKSVVAVSADRSGNAKFFHNGVITGTAVDVSSKELSNAAPAVYTHEGSGNLTKAGYLLIIVDIALDETQIQRLTAELERGIPDQRASSKVITYEYLGDVDIANELLDGDMELTGTANWLGAGSPFLTKQVSDLAYSTQCLRITINAVAGSYAYQNKLVVGRKYRVRGYARSDGAVNVPEVRCGASLWTGVASTSWQFFDIVFTADQVYLRLFCNASVGYVEFDLVAVREVGKAYFKINYKAELEAIANETTVSSGFLENTGIRVDSGSFKITTTETNKIIRKNVECVTDGSLYFPLMSSSVAGVNRYIDDVLVSTDLTTARTIPMTAGQVLIYASEDDKLSLYQEA